MSDTEGAEPTVWPEMSADITRAIRRADQVRERMRASGDGDRSGQVAADIERLTHRLAELDSELRALPTVADLEAQGEALRAAIDRDERMRRQQDRAGARQEEAIESIDDRVQLLEAAIRELRSENTTLIGYLEQCFHEIRKTDGRLGGRVEDVLQQFEIDLVAREERFADTQRQLDSLRSDHDRAVVAAEAAAESLRLDAERTAAELREEAEQTALELRDATEEARVLAEKAKDRADYAADSVAELQADFDEEMEDLRAGLLAAASKARLIEVETEVELRAKYSDLASLRQKLDDASDRLAKLDARNSELEAMATGADPISEAERVLRWQPFLPASAERRELPDAEHE